MARNPDQTKSTAIAAPTRPDASHARATLRSRERFSPALLTLLAIALVFPLTLPACSSTPGSPAATTKVSAADFKSPISAAGSVGGKPDASPDASTDKPADQPVNPPTNHNGDKPPIRTVAVDAIKPIRSGPVAASDNIFDATADVGQPVLSSETPKEIGAPIFVDAKIGDVNNRAIYASAFVNELGDRLTRAYVDLLKADSRRGKAAWRRVATEQIQIKLNGIIEDEVLRAEALNALKPEQKAGFFNWLSTVRSEVVAESRGIEAAANEQLSASNGTTLDQFMKTKEQQALIDFILQTRIKTRVNTSWRDIQLQYERQYNEYNPAPRAWFRIVSVPSRDEPEIKRITDALASGTPFDTIADQKLPPKKAKTDDETDATDEGREDDKFLIVSFDDEYDKHDFFGPKALNDAVHTLTPGNWTGPVVVGTAAYWIKLEKIQRMSMDLYNAQIGLEYGLTTGRTKYEQMRFVEKLKRRASFTDFDTMTRRLLVILEEYVTSNISKGKIPAAPVAAPATTPSGKQDGKTE